MNGITGFLYRIPSFNRWTRYKNKEHSEQILFQQSFKRTNRFELTRIRLPRRSGRIWFSRFSFHGPRTGPRMSARESGPYFFGITAQLHNKRPSTFRSFHLRPISFITVSRCEYPSKWWDSNIIPRFCKSSEFSITFQFIFIRVKNESIRSNLGPWSCT